MSGDAIPVPAADSGGQAGDTGDTRISAGALRMRYSRQRRRAGLRCLTLELRDSEIERLIALGHLRAADRDDHNAILLAVYAFLESSEIGDRHR